MHLTSVGLALLQQQTQSQQCLEAYTGMHTVITDWYKMCFVQI